MTKATAGLSSQSWREADISNRDCARRASRWHATRSVTGPCGMHRHRSGAQSCSCDSCRYIAVVSPSSRAPTDGPAPSHSWILVCELLRDAAAPRDAGDVDLLVAQLGDQAVAGSFVS